MFADFPPGLDLHHGTRLLAEMTAQELGIVYLAEEADALGVLAGGVGELQLRGNVAHLFLGIASEREQDMVELAVA